VSVAVKICGITDEVALETAIETGAFYVGFVFYPPSPRALTIEIAQKLASIVPAHVTTVGLFVDPTDGELRNVLRELPLGMIQLHGAEKPARVTAIRALTGLKVMKAIGVTNARDLDRAKNYDTVDQFLFDAKPQEGAIPGGTGSAFDWSLLAGRTFTKPWLLAGGLNAQNLAEAVKKSGAQAVDVSSGVEDRPGHKSSAKIREFMDAARWL
jgi:phosphoribosylanthranilate isomerase